MRRGTFFFAVIVLCTTIGLFLILYPSTSPVHAQNRLIITQSQSSSFLPASVMVQLLGIIFFDFDKDDIRPYTCSELSRIANEIRRYPVKAVIIEGHADSVGSEEYNMKLSLRRAESVKRWLQEQENLSGISYEIKGLGESRPDDSNETARGRANNRRVQIMITY